MLDKQEGGRLVLGLVLDRGTGMWKAPLATCWTENLISAFESVRDADSAGLSKASNFQVQSLESCYVIMTLL